MKQDPENLTEENIQYPVLWYNLAVLRFHQKNYRETLMILEKLAKTFKGVPSKFVKHYIIHVI